MKELSIILNDIVVKKGIFLSMFTIGVFSCSCAQKLLQSPKKINEKNGLVFVEAEDFISQSKSEVRKWYIMSLDMNPLLDKASADSHIQGASRNAYIKILPDTRTNHSEKLIPGENFTNNPGEIAIISYEVNFEKKGRYYVWGKAYSIGSEDNGLHVGIDGQWPESGQRMQWCDGKKSWYWESKQRTKEVHCGVPYQIYLDVNEPGIHKIQFSMREDGFELDQWLMTTDKDFNPRTDSRFDIVEVKTKKDKVALLNLVKEISPDALIIPALNFDTIGNGFYIDNNWLAIHPEKNKDDVASSIYKGKSGLYDIVLFAVGENDGRSEYEVLVNDSTRGSFIPPLSIIAFDEGPDYAKSFLGVEINTNDRISVKATIGSEDGKEYSRARWRCIVLVPSGKGEDLILRLKKN